MVLHGEVGHPVVVAVEQQVQRQQPRVLKGVCVTDTCTDNSGYNMCAEKFGDELKLVFSSGVIFWG